MPSIAVRSVYKKHTARVDIDPHHTVADLRQCLHAINEPQLAVSRLLFRGRIISDKTVVSSLGLGPNEFLTALPTKTAASGATPNSTRAAGNTGYTSTVPPTPSSLATSPAAAQNPVPTHPTPNTSLAAATNSQAPHPLTAQANTHVQAASAFDQTPASRTASNSGRVTGCAAQARAQDTAACVSHGLEEVQDQRAPRNSVPHANGGSHQGRGGNGRQECISLSPIMPSANEVSLHSSQQGGKRRPSAQTATPSVGVLRTPALSVSHPAGTHSSSQAARKSLLITPPDESAMSFTGRQSTEALASNNDKSYLGGGGFFPDEGNAKSVAEQLDSLLPGYLSRPNPSPAKPSQIVAAMQEAARKTGTMVPRCLFEEGSDTAEARISDAAGSSGAGSGRLSGIPGGNPTPTSVKANDLRGRSYVGSGPSPGLQADNRTPASVHPSGRAGTGVQQLTPLVQSTQGNQRGRDGTDIGKSASVEGAQHGVTPTGRIRGQQHTVSPASVACAQRGANDQCKPLGSEVQRNWSMNGNTGACDPAGAWHDQHVSATASPTVCSTAGNGMSLMPSTANRDEEMLHSNVQSKSNDWRTHHIRSATNGRGVIKTGSATRAEEVAAAWRKLLGACLEHVRGVHGVEAPKQRGTRSKGKVANNASAQGDAADADVVSLGKDGEEGVEPPSKRRKVQRVNGQGGRAKQTMGAAVQEKEDEDVVGADVSNMLDRLTRNDFTKRQAAAFAAVQLPPVLERLLQVFTILNHTYLLYARQHIQMTWRNSCKILQQLGAEVELTDADIRALSQLVPSVVVIKDRNHPHDDGPGSLKNGSQEGQASGSTVPGPNAGGYFEAGNGMSEAIAQGWSAGIARKAADAALNQEGAVLDGAGTVMQGDVESWIIEVMDPGKRAPPAVSTAQLEVDGVEPGRDGHIMSLMKLPPTKKAGEGVSRPSMQRRERAVRHALAFCTWLVHQKWAQSCGSDWDVFKERCWHPDFTAKLPDLQLGEVLETLESSWKSSWRPADQEWQHVRKTARPPIVTKKRPYCTDTTPLDTSKFLEHLQEVAWYEGQVVHIQNMDPRPARYGQPQQPLSPAIQQMLAAKGINNLFIHQAQAIDLIQSGQHTVIATSTASGKSLCYNLPILEAYAQDPNTCAIFMFPTKALAQDQLRALREMADMAFGDNAPIIEVYDGDTPQSERAAIRSRAQLLITNPDMLHMSVLPVHDSFARILANLKYVVVDEGHAYKGVFGCHTSVVLRRLRRVCSHHYHVTPSFVVTSATIANPGDHAAALLGVSSVTVVSEDGSPHGPKSFVLWNPPLSFPQGNIKSHTEARITSKLERVAAARDALRQANASVSRGIALARNSEQEWLAAVKQSRKRQQLRGELFDRRFQRKMASLVRDDLTPEQTNATTALDITNGDGDGYAHGDGDVDVGDERGKGGTEHGCCGRDSEPTDKVQIETVADRSAAGKMSESGANDRPRSMQEGNASVAANTGADAEEVVNQAGNSSHSKGQKEKGAQPRSAEAVVNEPGSGSLGKGQKRRSTRALGAEALAAISAVGDMPIRSRASYGHKNHTHTEHSTAHNHQLTSTEHSTVPDVDMVDLTGVTGPAGNGDTSQGAVDVGRRRETGSGMASYKRSRPVLRRRVFGVRLGVDGKPEGTSSEAVMREAQRQMDVVEESMASLTAGDRKQLFGAAGTPADQRRNSPIVEMSILLAEAIQHGIRTIAFCKTRKLCELVMAYTRETLKAHAPHLADRVKVYRGGYSPQERRQIESDLHVGNLLGVAATNALELGVDVGHLDCTLHLGFPGSVASLWQQAGRAGRREQSSVSIYVAFDGPLDQHFMRHPKDLFGRPIENVQVDSSNQVILQQHIICAASELPIDLEEDVRFFGAGLHEAVSALRSANLVGRHPHHPGSSLLYYVGPKDNPAADVSLRTIDPERFTIVNEADGRVLEEIEANMAFYEVYDGAVYLFQGRPYICKKLDLDNRTALVRPADIKYYTKVREIVNVHITGAKVAYPLPPTQHKCTSATCESALVAKRYLGFVRVWQGSGEVFDSVDLFLPDIQFETQAAYIRLPLSAKRECEQLGLVTREGLHAAGHAILNVLHLYIMCNPGDLGTDCDNPYDIRYRPEYLLVYDKHPGGIGLAGQVTPLFTELVERAYQLVTDCPCTNPKGCPNCIFHLDCGNYNAVLNKRAAEVVLRHVLEAERQHAQNQQPAAGGPRVPRGFVGVGADDDELLNNTFVDSDADSG